MSSSLGRAFTTKRAQKVADISSPLPTRSQTTKQKSMANLRDKISSPLGLISTTNNSVYDHPDIKHPHNGVKHSASTSSRSSNSGDESERSPTGTSTPLTSPDTSSIENSPTTVEPNHLSCYFGGPARKSNSSQEAPVIPQRAFSHTKRNAEVLAHQRSTSRTSSSTKSSHQSLASSTKSGYQSATTAPSLSSPKNSMSQARSSINMFSAHVETVEPHPFGKELAQVSELAEEFGASTQVEESSPVKTTIVDEDHQAMKTRGLFRFAAEDYISDIQSFVHSAFADALPTPLNISRAGGPVRPLWI